MASPRFMDNPDYVEYTRLIRRLHHLMSSGEDDSAEADSLRDAMDRPWSRLSPEEMDRARALSADLYTIGEAASPGHGTIDQGFLDQWQGAESARDWQKVLDLLREHRGLLPPDEDAKVRARCWAN